MLHVLHLFDFVLILRHNSIGRIASSANRIQLPLLLISSICTTGAQRWLGDSYFYMDDGDDDSLLMRCVAL